jgi:predicted acyl esterase
MELGRPNAKPGPRYALQRVAGILKPNVDIVDAPAGVRFERDVEVSMRDATILRVNVFLPPQSGPFPVVMCAHPYGKDALPKRGAFGYAPVLQCRILRQAGRPHYSAWTSWESPDPAYWTSHGYAVVNADLRGFGRSDGVGTLLSDQESQDYYDLIEWAGAQPWSTGRVGLNGVSYLALSQWKTAALRPPHLAAICPWEGFSDLYRDFARPGGIREDGFLPIWSKGVSAGGRVSENLRQEQLARPLWDEWWAARCAQLERIDVPALICASFSDQGLHSRGSFEAFERIGSKHRWLYTHRGGKWGTYYSDEALAFQKRFFDCFLKDEANGMLDVPPVRLEVRKDRETVREVRAETSWPPASVRWTPLYLGADGTLAQTPRERNAVAFDAATGTASFVWQVRDDVEVVGPMVLRVPVSLQGCDDATLFAFVRKIALGANVPFEGAYGFGYDVVAKGWLKLSLRKLEAVQPAPWRPAFSFDQEQKLAPGEIVGATIELLPSATFFEAGSALQLDVRGRWLYPRKNPPILGPQFYETEPRARVTLHCGTGDAYLLTPLIGSDVDVNASG